MTRQFTFPPEVYRAESEKISKFWTAWLPALCLPVFVILVLVAPEPFYKWAISERTGIIEFTNFLFPLIVAILAIRMLFFRFIQKDKLLVLWCAAMAIGGIYLGGEEASWGQHYVGWTTPEYWSGLNDQQETNFHNISHWIDQKPRLLLTIGIWVTGLIYPWLLLNKPGLLPSRFDFTYPALALMPLALLVLISEAYLHAKLVLIPQWFTDILRPGELQELYICWFLLVYAIVLFRRARQGEKDLA